MYWAALVIAAASTITVWAMWGVRDDYREGRDRPPFVLRYVEGNGTIVVPRLPVTGLHRARRRRHRRIHSGWSGMPGLVGGAR
ncbi:MULTISPECIES: hypothetical protein [unclassified Nocardia]|uniref:hypothetical protein n=1 Tax=unclassified Nocardia TaxID=2637762 RepID=UPI0024A81D80|nr:MULTISPECIES: hypothetical protein [unclassified Nocardia]